MPISRNGDRTVAREVAAGGAQAAAVCLLLSFEHPDHERLPGEEPARLVLSVSLSSDILPEYREYERASTTLINAYITPVMRGYMDRLDGFLEGGPGSCGPMRLMHSAGGGGWGEKRGAGRRYSEPPREPPSSD